MSPAATACQSQAVVGLGAPLALPGQAGPSLHRPGRRAKRLAWRASPRPEPAFGTLEVDEATEPEAEVGGFGFDRGARGDGTPRTAISARAGIAEVASVAEGAAMIVAGSGIEGGGGDAAGGFPQGP